MAITFTAGTSVESTASVTTATVALAAGMAAGDYTICVVSLNASTGTIDTPAGWTEILPDTQATASTSMTLAIFYRKWVSGDGDVVVTHKSGRSAATTIRVRGADATTFMDVGATVTQAAAAATTIVAPTITPTTGWLVCVFAGRHPTNGGIITPFSSLSAGMTSLAEASAQAPTQTNAGHLIAYQAVTPSSATGTRQADPNVSTTGAMGVSFSLVEAASGGPGNVTAVKATATSQEGTPVVTGQANIVHVKASGTATDIVPVVTAAATVTGVRAQGSSLARVPVVVGAQTATVAAVRAQGSSSASAPVVTALATLAAVRAQGSSLAIAPAVLGAKTASVTAVRAQGSSLAVPPVVVGGAGATAVAAQGSSAAVAPAVSALASVTAVRAQGTSLAVPPTVTAAASATVASPAMLATATGMEPFVSGGGPANIDAVPATATADLRNPVVSAPATVAATKASASTAMPEPVPSSAVTIQSVPSAAAAEAQAPVPSVLVVMVAVSMVATALHHAPTFNLEAITAAVVATATALALRPSLKGDIELYLKDGTLVHPHILIGGILVPVDSQF